MSEIKSSIKLYHWFYGPMTVVSDTDSLIIVSIDDPGGITEIPGDKRVAVSKETIKRFNLKEAMGIWLFSQADQIVKSKVYDIKQQHKYYSPENIILMKKQEIEKLKAQIIENEFNLKQNIDTRSNLLVFKANSEQKIVNNIENKKQKQLTINNSKDILNDIVEEIRRINEKRTSSPRESKVNLEKLSLLEKRKLDLEAGLNGLQKFIKEFDNNMFEIENENKKQLIQQIKVENSINQITIEIEKINQQIFSIEKQIVDIKSKIQNQIK